jgi:hypothetical protein
MAPGDYYEVKPAHAHLPLVVMLVLTQLSVPCASFFVISLVGTSRYNTEGHEELKEIIRLRVLAT